MKNLINNHEINLTQLNLIYNSALKTRKTVNQFGQTINNPNLIKDETVIEADDILTELYNQADLAFDLSGFDMYDTDNLLIEQFGEVCRLEQFETGGHNSTYNWSAPISNHLDYKHYILEDDSYLLIVNIHNGYGDIRGGYLLQFAFLFENYRYDFSFVDVLMDSSNIFKLFSINDVSFYFNLFTEAGVFNVYDKNTGFEDYDIYIGDYNDCIEYANNLNLAE